MSRSLEESDEGVYHVEVITSARVNDDAEWEYLVSWAGYSSDEDSWEPAENVLQCERLLASFWKHIGIDDQDYSPGDQFHAQPWWIKRERDFFANQWGKKKKRKKSSRDKHYSFTISGFGSKKGNMNKNKSLKEFVQQQNDSQSDYSTDDSDEVPLSKSQAPKNNEETLPARRRKSITQQSDPGSRTDGGSNRKGKRGSTARETSKTFPTQTASAILKGKRRRRVSTPESMPADDTAISGEPPRPKKLAKTSSVSQPAATFLTPSTPMRQGDTSNRDSPSSLFSAPSSPAPILSRPAAPPPPLSLPPPLPPSPGTNVAGPSSRPLPPPPPPPKAKAIRKPSWLLQPKIKRFDAPNLKPSSTLPTKVSLFEATKTSEGPQSPTSGGGSAAQTPISATAPRPPFALDEFSGPGPNPDVDALHQSHAHSPQSIEPPVPLLPPASLAETEAFLSDIMPPELSEPMIDGAEPNQPPVRKLSTADILKNTHIPRKYKWNGELCINTEQGHKERVCNVSLSESSEGSMDRLHLSLCYNSSVSFLLLEKLYSLAELQCLRPALTHVAEVAKLGPDGEADKEPLNTLFIHMSSRRLVSCSTIHFDDDNQVALLIVFPATNLILCKEYNVLPDLRKAGHFIAALLPWKIVGKKARTHRLHRDPSDRTHPVWPQEVIPAKERDLSLNKDPSYHCAFSMLGFPKWLYDDLSKPEYKYCIWNKDGDGSQAEPGSDTMALKRILKERPAKDVGLKADAFVVFVHVGALKTLAALPAFMERRMKRPDVQFVTYGTHHTVPPARWGMRLIYRLGGIATISPSVFVECPSAAYKLLDMLEQHPLWDCFVTPGVVALAARQNRGSDPVSEFERGKLIHQDLLSRIGQGQLSLLRSPPHYGSGESALFKWIRWQQEMSMLDPRGILEWCLRSFSEQYSDHPEEKWTSQVLDDLSSVLNSLQMQPSIMDQYRRFVVITGKQDRIGYDRSGFEWTVIDEFNFRDDFIPKESMDDLRAWANVEKMMMM